MNRFDKEEDRSIFRLAIFGDSKEAVTLQSKFDCNLCNAATFNNIEDLIFWNPNTIMFVDGDWNIIHQLLMETKVSINIMCKLDPTQVIRLVEDYRGVESGKRLAYRVIEGTWSGTADSVNNVYRLYSMFHKETQRTIFNDLVSAYEGSILHEMIDWDKSYDMEARLVTYKVPTNRLNRLKKELDSAE